ncbi:hypothetical protein HLB23_38415 [Nocardia uniformis]|uniref:Uncharacterized protein n=1 Tax=Nocardia uniformis TaxID=53432 RepID=A0A849CKP6_9NOCA|nr:hypothetical protein [Nocardia uniformis]NNH75661.1 hypothetical protein [Nocardia uniformis]
MTIQVLEPLITSDQTQHRARSVGHGGWVVSWLPGRTITLDQAVAAIQLAEVAAALSDLTKCLGLTPCEAIGQAMLEGRAIDARTIEPVAGFDTQAGGM